MVWWKTAKLSHFRRIYDLGNGNRTPWVICLTRIFVYHSSGEMTLLFCYEKIPEKVEYNLLPCNNFGEWLRMLKCNVFRIFSVLGVSSWAWLSKLARIKTGKIRNSWKRIKTEIIVTEKLNWILKNDWWLALFWTRKFSKEQPFVF